MLPPFASSVPSGPQVAGMQQLYATTSSPSTPALPVSLQWGPEFSSFNVAAAFMLSRLAPDVMVVVVLWKAGLVKVIVALVGFGLIRVSDVVAPPKQLMLGLG